MRNLGQLWIVGILATLALLITRSLANSQIQTGLSRRSIPTANAWFANPGLN